MRRLAILSVLLIAGCGSVTTTTETKTTAHILLQTVSKSGCHTRDGGKLPDPICTPGVADPNINQDNIHQTICVSGYSKTVRPPVRTTNAIKREQIILYGYKDQNLSDYEEDHLISLELGGAADDPKNLWPESPKSPNPKDQTENRLHREVCAGTISLAAAQRAISTDWTAVK